MTARSEQIMTAIETALTGLTTTGTKVQRGQVYPHEIGQLPALGVLTGADVPSNEHQTGLLDWELTAYVEAVAEITAGYTAQASTIESSLATIRAEVHAALLADYTLGLAFVIDIAPGPVAQPMLDGDGKIPIGSLLMAFVIQYRTSRGDIEA